MANETPAEDFEENIAAQKQFIDQCAEQIEGYQTLMENYQETDKQRIE